jgi:hypothetical protein
MTNIVAAMREMENVLSKIPKENPVWVVFISDGDDTCNGGLNSLMNKLNNLKGNQGRKNFNFMCVGVGSGFPTRVSMYLRERYHRGNDAVPSIFCIEYISEKAFKNKLDGVMKFCEVRGVVELNNGVIAVPWVGENKDAVEGTWVVSRFPKLRMGRKGVSLIKDEEKFNSLTTEVESKKEDFSIDAVADVFRAWSQKLQLDAINNTITFVQAKEFAQSTHGLMTAIVEDIKKSRGLDIVTGKVDSGIASFLDQVLNLQINRTGMRIAGYLTAVEEIKNGRDLSKLDQFEAAKIIGLGTITGKAQQRANALKNMTQAKLTEYIEEFIAAYEQIEIKDTTGFTPSFKTNRTFHTLLKDETLASGLRKFNSPLDFLDTFPLFGAALNIKRADGTANSVWKASVKSYFNSEVETSTFDFATYSLQIKEGEQTNCVCPLISKEDAYLAPLYNTNLIKYLISYNVTEQLDFINDDPWLLMLSDLFVLAYKAEDKAMVARIMETLDALFGVDKTIGDLIEAIEVEDLDEYKNFKRKSTKILLHYYVMQRSELEDEEKENIMQRLWVMYYRYRLSSESIKAFVQTEAMSGLQEAIMAKYTPEYISQKFYTTQEVVRHCRNNLIDEMSALEVQGSSNNIKLIPSAFTSDVNNDISFKLLKTIFKEVLPSTPLKSEESMLFLGHCTQKGSNAEYEPIEITMEEAKIKLTTAVSSSSESAGLKKRIMYACMDQFKKTYLKSFKGNHWGVTPKSWEEIVKICEEKGIDASKLDYNPETQMVRNACMSDNCPHQFVPKTRRKLANHMGGWQGLCPKAFHQFVTQHSTESPEEVYTKFCTQRNIKDISAFGVDKQKVLDYIVVIQKSFTA